MWGPRAWREWHEAAIFYPARPAKADAEAMALRLGRMIAGLPCARCRRHAAEHVRADPPDLRSSLAFQAWVWRFHNSVNRRLGKPELPYDAYLELYAEQLLRAELR